MNKGNSNDSLILLGPVFFLMVVINFAFTDRVFDKMPLTMFVIGQLVAVYLFIKIYNSVSRNMSSKTLVLFGWLGWIGSFGITVGWILFQLFE